jgi:hypothetical protein
MAFMVLVNLVLVKLLRHAPRVSLAPARVSLACIALTLVNKHALTRVDKLALTPMHNEALTRLPLTHINTGALLLRPAPGRPAPGDQKAHSTGCASKLHGWHTRLTRLARRLCARVSVTGQEECVFAGTWCLLSCTQLM